MIKRIEEILNDERLDEDLKIKMKFLRNSAIRQKQRVNIIVELSDKYQNRLKKANEELDEYKNNLEQRVKEEIQKNKEQQLMMFQQSKLAQMGEMITMIAHQWRQPLNSISATSISVIIKANFNQLDSQKIINQMEYISNCTSHLSSTIDDFRNFFKQNKNKEKINFCNLIEDVLKISQTSITHHKIEIIKDLHCKESFQTYENELKQVILNIIKNAEDALVENKIKNPFIKLSTYNEKNSYILEISDNGGGIPVDIIDKVFDSHFSTKLEKDGTGLGLYMSKTIIEEHCNGELTVTNNPEGAVFKITL